MELDVLMSVYDGPAVHGGWCCGGPAGGVLLYPETALLVFHQLQRGVTLWHKL